MSFLGNVLSKVPGLPKPRSGQLTQTRFKATTEQSPITDAVKLTSTVNEGGKVTEHKESTRVNLRNGSSLSSNGKQVSVRDSDGLLTKEFSGSIDVAKGHVSVKDHNQKSAQTFGQDGQAVLTGNGLLVQLSPDGTARSLKPEGDTWVPGSSGVESEGRIQLGDGTEANPILSQQWLLSS